MAIIFYDLPLQRMVLDVLEDPDLASAIERAMVAQDYALARGTLSEQGRRAAIASLRTKLWHESTYNGSETIAGRKSLRDPDADVTLQTYVGQAPILTWTAKLLVARACWRRASGSCRHGMTYQVIRKAWGGWYLGLSDPATLPWHVDREFQALVREALTTRDALEVIDQTIPVRRQGYRGGITVRPRLRLSRGGPVFEPQAWAWDEAEQKHPYTVGFDELWIQKRAPMPALPGWNTMTPRAQAEYEKRYGITAMGRYLRTRDIMEIDW